jgi:hypothetical protein
MADTDIATLTLRLDASQFTDGLARAKQATDGLTRAQQELIARADKLVASAQSIDIQNKKAVQTYVQEVAQLRATAQGMGALHLIQAQTVKSAADVQAHHAAVTTQMRALTAEAARSAAAQRTLGTATGLTSSGLNSVRASLTGLAASLLGTAPGVAQFTSALGTMAVGSGVMIGVLAGLAALGFAWDKLTEKTRKAKQETEEALRSLSKLRDRERQGAGGETVDHIDRARQQLAKDRAALVALQQQSVGPSTQFSIVGGGFSAAQGDPVAKAKQIEKLQADIAAGERAVARAVRESSETSTRAVASNLAALVAGKQATKAEIQNAEGLLQGYRNALNALSGDSSKNAERAQLIQQIRELDDALHPKKTDSGAARAASQARTLGNIAEQEERRVEAAKALNSAAQQGQAAYEREVRSQALKNQLLETEQRIRAQFLDQNGKQKAGSEAAMAAEIARARAAIQAQDELGQKTRASLDVEKDEQALAILKAKTDAYADASVALADSTIEQEYAVRVTEAMAIADEELRQKKLALAAAIRDQARAYNAVSDAAEAQKKEFDATERERERERERRARQVERSVSGAIGGALEDVFNRRNPLPGLVASVKAAVIRGFADALAARLTAPILKVLGFEVPADKMARAGKDINAAGDKILRGAELISGRDPSGGGTVPPSGPSAMQERFKQAMGVVGAGVGGFGTGYGLGQATGSGAIGAVGGALAGAKLGAAFGPPGMIVGAIAGFAGGMLGASDAAKQAAAALAAARKAYQLSMDDLRATVNNDDLGRQIAAAEAQRDQLNGLLVQSLSFGDMWDLLFDKTGRYTEELAKLNGLTEERIAQLTREHAAMQQNQISSFRERELRAQGKTKEADELARQREMADLLRSFGPEQDDVEKQIAAALAAAHAAERNTTALDRNTDALTRLHNAPTGYKVESRIFDFRTPAQREVSSPLRPSSPMLPQSPTTTQPQLTRSVTIAPVFNIDGTKSTREQVKSIATELRKVVTETLGKDADVADGWGLLA